VAKDFVAQAPAAAQRGLPFLPANLTNMKNFPLVRFCSFLKISEYQKLLFNADSLQMKRSA